MKVLLILLLSSLAMSAFAQTDIIEMRSRNASLKKYERVSKIKSSDHAASNFGMLPPDGSWSQPELIEVTNAVLDSVKCISDSVAIMYTSNYCTNGFTIDPRSGTKWQPGADTVVNHPLFRPRHSLDSVKAVINSQYYFKLPADSITFIGFDAGQGISNEDAVKDIKQKRNQQKNSFAWELIFMILTPIAFVFGMNKLGAVGTF